MKNLKIIIPGGAGFVGRNLVKFLTNFMPPQNITVIDKNADQLRLLHKYGINLLETDLTRQNEGYNAFFGNDVIIHLAAQISSRNPQDFYRNNIDTTEHIIEAAKDASIKKIIYFSSAAVLSIRKDLYAETKLQAEELVKQSGLRYCILQPSMMYGPTDDKNIGYLIQFAKKMPFFPIPGHGRWPRQPIYIDDICHLVMHILKEFPENTIYTINGEETIFFRDMVKMVFQELDKPRIMIPLPIPLFKLLMMTYQKISGKIQFTPDQVDSLASCEVFPEYPWWDEFHIPVTTFKEGIRMMIREGK